LKEAREQVQKEGEWTGQLRQMTKDERELLVESRWTRVNNDAGQPNAILVINTDITEKHKLELQLLRAQRMESIGTLAGGIAHDLNNVLTPVQMATQLMQMQPRNESDARLLRNIEVSAQRGAGMVKQVLAFARGQEGDMAVLQLKHIIREMEKIMRETFPKTIAIKTDIATNLPTIKGDATQLHQILLNLCVNARDAMPDGGELLINTESVTLDEVAAGHILGAKRGLYVSLRVTDTGTGMPPEVIDRIFEPFYTTKGVGKGTGLGLSTVMSIVKSHGALIDVTSVVGKGTTFTVLFPPAESVAASKPAEARPANTAGDGHLVLVVDDEPLILTLTKTVLTQHGYRVLEAEDGLRGLTLFQQHAADIDVVLIDMMMPVMGGQDAIKAMRRVRPDVPFIAISGLMQAREICDDNGGDRPVLLQKPFTSDKILETLQKVIDPRASRPGRI
jgi:signal transduction histidine kinase/ActR/RegA family two-component response regulator